MIVPGEYGRAMYQNAVVAIYKGLEEAGIKISSDWLDDYDIGIKEIEQLIDRIERKSNDLIRDIVNFLFDNIPWNENERKTKDSTVKAEFIFHFFDILQRLPYFSKVQKRVLTLPDGGRNYYAAYKNALADNDTKEANAIRQEMVNVLRPFTKTNTLKYSKPLFWTNTFEP